MRLGFSVFLFSFFVYGESLILTLEFYLTSDDSPDLSTCLVLLGMAVSLPSDLRSRKLQLNSNPQKVSFFSYLGVQFSSSVLRNNFEVSASVIFMTGFLAEANRKSFLPLIPLHFYQQRLLISCRLFIFSSSSVLFISSLLLFMLVLSEGYLLRV